MNSTGERAQYRADIDGLRAVAVLSVLLFHIDDSWLPGGYTGVDIFFVISGFLITRIIAHDIEQHRFSILGFYVRRIKRILPVFYTVTAITVGVGFILLIPEDFSSLLASMRHAVVFVANLYFSRETGYFDIAADEKPLLHMWSLSIEEQYYFLWPSLLLLFYVVGRKVFKQPVVLSQKASTLFTLGLVIVGFVLAQYALTRNGQSESLYMALQTRFCELMVGSCVALLPVSRDRRLHRALSYLGVALIVFALFYLNKNSVFPGYNALVPCLGAAFLIYAGQMPEHTQAAPNAALSVRAMVWVGLLSYSLYLWHWPVLAYMRYVYGQYRLPPTWLLFAIPAIFALAVLSYRYVEQPTRRLKVTFPAAFVVLFMVPAVALVGASYAAGKYRSRHTFPAELTSYGKDVCHGNFDRNCVRGNPLATPRVLVTGDSHAAALNHFIDVVGRHEGWSAQVYTATSCSPVFGFNEKVLAGWAHEPCNALKRYVQENYDRYDAVVLASQWAYQLGMEGSGSDPLYLQKLERTLREMAGSVPVYVVSDVPSLAVSPFRTLRFSQIGQIMNRPLPNEYQQANAVVKKLVESIPNAHYVDLSEAWKGITPQGTYQGKAAYFDGHHLNMFGSASLGRLFVASGQQLIGPMSRNFASTR